MEEFLKRELGDIQLPDYSDKCIVNIPKHINYLHGLAGSSALGTDRTGDLQKTVLFILDGFGYSQWKRFQPDLEILRKISKTGRLESLTSGFPSTTSASLSTLSTGLSPQQHGLLEWLIYEEELDRNIFTLPFTAIGQPGPEGLAKEQANPRILLNTRTHFEELKDRGIKSYTLILNEYAYSSYSNLAYAGSDVVEHGDITKLFQNLENVLSTDEKSHVHVYWSNIDAVGHQFGPDSREYSEQVKIFFDTFEIFLKKVSRKFDWPVEIMFVSDHGQVGIDPHHTVWLDKWPELSENLAISERGIKILPWGSPRDLFIKVKKGKIEETATFLRDKLDGIATVAKSSELLKSGIFGGGELHSRFESRIGDLVVLPKANNTVWYKHFSGEAFNLKGMHGGLSKDEMVVPFASIKLHDIW